MALCCAFLTAQIPQVKDVSIRFHPLSFAIDFSFSFVIWFSFCALIISMDDMPTMLTLQIGLIPSSKNDPCYAFLKATTFWLSTICYSCFIVDIICHLISMFNKLHIRPKTIKTPWIIIVSFFAIFGYDLIFTSASMVHLSSVLYPSLILLSIFLMLWIPLLHSYMQQNSWFTDKKALSQICAHKATFIYWAQH